MNIKQLFIVAVLLLGSCTTKETELAPIIFDLEKEYPQKELDYSKYYSIDYKKINADSVALGVLRIIYASGDSIVTFSKNTRSIYLFGQNGQLLSHFDKTGNSGEEYTGISDAFYDQVRKEIYVLDVSKSQIIVYNLSGRCQRRFTYDSKENRIAAIRNYNDDEFICYNNTIGIIKENGDAYSIRSKQTGEIRKNIRIQIPEKRTPYVFHSKGVSFGYEIPFGYSKEGIFLNESSCDTIFSVTIRNGKVAPRIIKTPAILSYENSLRRFLYVISETAGYISFYKLTVEQPQPDSRPSFKASYYFYDKTDGGIYKESTVLPMESESPNPFAVGQITNFDFYGESIHAYTLKVRSEKGILSGKLKELADSMNEEDNPVIRIFTATK